ncbi:DNA-binding response regulator, LytR/AlgR family [Paenimyroides ummariense]|uniref:DNA-binding response regulator, LytR/AlgR family n=1 Tax=Paenimyroides ummariense TaxID=913024 RepID=A0A1I5EXK5_9FLAO|nr:LytTR family DNA-binding domain-containing protein [Paenimyroides ummariense]SFO16268.1 DNA-binding response regulator, LytR/AlgR family [Paenimyroides ummariense]
MEILIIEDEKPNADRLTRLILGILPQANIVAVLDSVADSVSYLKDKPVLDVIMMDIHLSDGISFEIFENVKVDIPIIFTTAYDSYAINAFKQNSIDYLLKPIEAEELEVSFSKLQYVSEVTSAQSIEKLLNDYRPKQYRSRFLIPFRDGFKTLLVSDIILFYSVSRVTYARLGSGIEHIVPKTLDELEQELDPKIYFRANRQFIIHIDWIDKVHNYFNSKLKVVIKKFPETEILISREKAPIFKNWLGY